MGLSFVDARYLTSVKKTRDALNAVEEDSSSRYGGAAPEGKSYFE